MPVGNPEGYNETGDPSSGVQEEGAGGGGQAEAMKGIQAIQTAMDQLGQGLQQAGAPPELLDALGRALSAYSEFLAMFTGEGGAPAPQGKRPMNEMDAQAGGNPNAEMA